MQVEENIKVNGKIILDMVMASCIIKMEADMKDIG